jgi:hypothetical protein
MSAIQVSPYDLRRELRQDGLGARCLGSAMVEGVIGEKVDVL